MRVAWLAVPFTTGELLASALDSYTSPFRTSCAIGLWIIWGTTAVAAMIARPFTLGFVRIWMPAGLAVAIWALIETQSSDRLSGTEPTSFLIAISLAVTTLAAVSSLVPSIGTVFINNQNTDLEKRLLLRPPAAVAFVLVPLVWAVIVAGAISGYLLLAAQRWVIGAVVLVAGIAIVAHGYRSLLILTKRWAVFVPAGLVLHDPLTLGDEAILLPKSAIMSLQIIPASARRQEVARRIFSKKSQPSNGPQLNQSMSDLCAGSLGVAVELRLHEPARVPRLHKPPELATTIRFAPTSTHTFTQEALARDIVS